MAVRSGWAGLRLGVREGPVKYRQTRHSPHRANQRKDKGGRSGRGRSLALEHAAAKDIDLIVAQSRERLHVGIRPSDITLHRDDVGSGWKGEVYLVEQVGRSYIFTVKVNGDMLKVKMPLEFNAAVGEHLYLAFNPDKIYLFDENTGQSI